MDLSFAIRNVSRTVAAAAVATSLVFAASNASAQCTFSNNTATTITETCATAGVGIGTATPASTLNVVSGTNPAVFIDTFSASLGQIPFVFRTARGTSGAPSALLAGDIFGGVVGRGYRGDTFSGGSANIIFFADGNWSPTSTPSKTSFRTTPVNATAGVDRVTIASDGKVGIGTTTPTKTLDVVGDANFSGTVTGGNIAAQYQDVAEWVPSTGELPAGTVVILDPTKTNHVIASETAYDTSVAGVVSAKPGIILGEASANKAKIATTGRVRVRVTADAAPIRIGDLLVTSEIEGVAMKSQPIDLNGRKFHQPGTVIGKALEPLASGEGEILVLLSLQ